MSKRSRHKDKEGNATRPLAAGDVPQSAAGMKRGMAWLAVPVATVASLTAVGLLCVLVYQARAENPAKPKPADARQPAVEEMIRRYFRTWSNQDMKGYGDCFHPNAAIQFIDANGRIEHFGVPAFINFQARILRGSKPQTETAESIEVTFEAKLCRVVVFWKLTGGERDVFGYDHFTLTQQEGKWKIVNLVYYESERVR